MAVKYQHVCREAIAIPAMYLMLPHLHEDGDQGKLYEWFTKEKSGNTKHEIASLTLARY